MFKIVCLFKVTCIIKERISQNRTTRADETVVSKQFVKHVIIWF